jgi:hypothetical protein
MQDMYAQREKLLVNAADCELIANLATDAKKREMFEHLAKQMRKFADDVGAEISAREGKDAA